MIIELIGMPGSGKTHVSGLIKDVFAQSNHEKGLIVLSENATFTEFNSKNKMKFLKFFSNLNLFSISYLKDTFQILIYNHPFRNGVYLSLYYLMIIKRYNTYFKRKTSDSFDLLIDEGFFHSWCGTLNKNIEPKRFTRLLNKLISNLRKNKYFPFESNKMVYVFVDSSVQDCFNRIEKRESGWPKILKNLTCEQKMKELIDFENQIRLLKIALRKNDFYVFEIANDSTLNYQVLELVEWINSTILKDKMNVTLKK